MWKLRVRIVLAASWPNAITYILFALRFVSDIYFLGQIGVSNQAAWATGYVMILMFLSFGMGMLFAVNSIVSKNFGRRWYAVCGSVTWQGIWFSLICGIGVVVLYVLAPMIINLFGHDAELRELELSYLRIALVSTVFQLVAWGVIHFFIAINRPFFPLFIALITLIVHVCCNYVFTIGNLGFTRLGISGAGWSLVISSIVMAGTALLFFTVPKSLRKFHTRNARPSWNWFRKVTAEGFPIGGRQIIDEFVWNVVLIWIIGQFGPIHLAAAAVLISILDVFILAFDSIGMTSVSLIGNAIGSHKIGKAERWKLTCLLITSLYAAVSGILFYLFREPIVSVFSDSPEVTQLSVALAFVIPVFLLIYAIYSTYDHALCATEDNAWPSVVSLICSIVFLGGGGIILVLYFFDTGSYGAWGLLLLNVFVVAVLYAVRWSFGYWKPERPAISSE